MHLKAKRNGIGSSRKLLMGIFSELGYPPTEGSIIADLIYERLMEQILNGEEVNLFGICGIRFSKPRRYRIDHKVYEGSPYFQDNADCHYSTVRTIRSIVSLGLKRRWKKSKFYKVEEVSP